MGQIKNNEGLVESVLKEVPKTRDDDISLILVVWGRQGLKLKQEQVDMIKRCTHPETITRIRRKLQSNGLYKASHEVHQKRLFAQKQYANKEW